VKLSALQLPINLRLELMPQLNESSIDLVFEFFTKLLQDGVPFAKFGIELSYSINEILSESLKFSLIKFVTNLFLNILHVFKGCFLPQFLT